MNTSDLITLVAGLEAPTLIFFAWVVRKLGSHDVALALLIQQVNPPGDKSLRTLLNDLQIAAATTNAQTSGNGQGHS